MFELLSLTENRDLHVFVNQGTIQEPQDTNIHKSNRVEGRKAKMFWASSQFVMDIP